MNHENSFFHSTESLLFEDSSVSVRTLVCSYVHVPLQATTLCTMSSNGTPSQQIECEHLAKL